jgi:hypothetical protein
VIQKTESEDECFDIEKREGSEGPKFQSHIEVEVLAMKRMEETAEDLHREARTG